MSPLTARQRVEAVRLIGEAETEKTVFEMEIDALNRFLAAAQDLEGLGYSVRPPVKLSDTRRRYDRWHARMAARAEALQAAARESDDSARLSVARPEEDV